MAGFSTPAAGMHPLDTIEAWFTANFKEQFGTSDDGADSELGSFIGMEYHKDKDLMSIRCTHTRETLREAMESHNIPILDNINVPLPPNAVELAYAPANDTDNPLIPGFPVRMVVGSSSFMAMAADPFASLPCCLLSQFGAPEKVTKNVAFLSQWLGSFMVTHDRPIVYRRGNGCADCITEGDAAWANKPDQTNFHGWFQYMCDAVVDWRSFSGRQVHSSTRGAELLTSVDATHAVISQRTSLFEYRLGPTGPMTLGMDSTATIGGTTKDNIPKKSRHEAIRIAILRQATRDWIIAPTYRNTNEMSADVMTKVMPLAKLLYFYPRVYGKL